LVPRRGFGLEGPKRPRRLAERPKPRPPERVPGARRIVARGGVPRAVGRPALNPDGTLQRRGPIGTWPVEGARLVPEGTVKKGAAPKKGPRPMVRIRPGCGARSSAQTGGEGPIGRGHDRPKGDVEARFGNRRGVDHGSRKAQEASETELERRPRGHAVRTPRPYISAVIRPPKRRRPRRLVRRASRNPRTSCFVRGRKPLGAPGRPCLPGPVLEGGGAGASPAHLPESSAEERRGRGPASPTLGGPTRLAAGGPQRFAGSQGRPGLRRFGPGKADGSRDMGDSWTGRPGDLPRDLRHQAREPVTRFRHCSARPKKGPRSRRRTPRSRPNGGPAPKKGTSQGAPFAQIQGGRIEETEPRTTDPARKACKEGVLAKAGRWRAFAVDPRRRVPPRSRWKGGARNPRRGQPMATATPPPRFEEGRPLARGGPGVRPAVTATKVLSKPSSRRTTTTAASGVEPSSAKGPCS